MTADPASGRPVVCFPFVGDHIGGSHISALGLITNLDASRFAPLVVLHEKDGPLAELLASLNVGFEVAPVPNSIGFAEEGRGGAFASALAIAKALPSLAGYLRRRKVEIVHTNDGRMHVTWGLAARLVGAKLLWHHRGDPRSAGLRYVAPWLANRLAVVSHFASPKGFLSAADRSVVVRSPFDTDLGAKVDRTASRTSLAEEFGLRQGSCVVGYVGTMQARKRPLVFVEVIAEIRRLAPDLEVHGVFLGTAVNDLDAAVRSRAAELGVSDRVHLLGFRYPSERWIAALDLLLVTAVNEPFGRTLIEAMLLKTTVVAAASGGNLEAIQQGRTGILSPPDNATAFAKAVIDQLRSPGRRATITEAAYRDARRRYGIARHVEAVSEIYDKLLTL